MADTSDGRSGPADVRSRDGHRWAAVALALALGAVNAGLGVVTGRAPFVVVALAYFGGVALYFTAYWHRVLYLLAALHTGALGVLWLLNGAEYLLVGVGVGVLGIAFFLLTITLYVDRR